MSDDHAMEAAVKAYVANFNAARLDGIVDLFAKDASVEDPVGTEPRIGHAALREFFGVGIAAGAKLSLDGPVRTAADHAAFAFHVTLEWDGATRRIDVIDTFRFDDNGKIVEMRAFFGPGNSSIVGDN